MAIECLSKNKNNENFQTNAIRKSQGISACEYWIKTLGDVYLKEVKTLTYKTK